MNGARIILVAGMLREQPRRLWKELSRCVDELRLARRFLSVNALLLFRL